jgi:putative DNA methylase
MIGSGTNALASSIVLVCRKRSSDAPSISRREFIRELNAVLPEALDEMTKGTGDEQSPVAPVDLSQAIIGPGMAVFSKYSAVLESDGTPMSVRTALQLLIDSSPKTILTLIPNSAFTGSNNTDGKKALLELQTSSHGPRAPAYQGLLNPVLSPLLAVTFAFSDPANTPKAGTPNKMNVHPCGRLFINLSNITNTGETATGRILGKIAEQIEGVRQLAYRLYTLCERAGWAEDARAYNELMTSWGR